ncbi:MAG: Fic family protein [Algicola sp.]|nr:Fic family protein [Algicola sp.]
MHDKYGAGQDPYTWKNSAVLRNKLFITDDQELTDVERQVTQLAAHAIVFNGPPFNLQYWQHIHRQLFCELFEWAGQLRTIIISKGETNFGLPQGIDRQCKMVFKQLANDNNLVNLDKPQFINKLAEYYCELNACHPFRDGNGRAQRILFEHIALNAGYNLNFANTKVNQWVNANKHGMVCNYQPMIEIMSRCIFDTDS